MREVKFVCPHLKVACVDGKWYCVKCGEEVLGVKEVMPVEKED